MDLNIPLQEEENNYGGVDLNIPILEDESDNGNLFSISFLLHLIWFRFHSHSIVSFLLIAFDLNAPVLEDDEDAPVLLVDEDAPVLEDGDEDGDGEFHLAEPEDDDRDGEFHLAEPEDDDGNGNAFHSQLWTVVCKEYTRTLVSFFLFTIATCKYS